MLKKRDYVNLITLPHKECLQGLAEFNGLNSQGKYVVLSSGTSVRRRVKAWDEKKFGDLAVLLKEKYDLSPLFVGGEDNIEVNDKIIEIIKERDGNKKINILNLTGKVGLSDLCYLLKNASLFVGVDSGIMHLAASFDIPVVGIFGPSDPFYVGPQNSKSIVVRNEDMDCVPCYLKGCKDRECMKKLEVKKVFDACEQLLGEPGKLLRGA